MERDSDEECVSDIEEEIIPMSGAEENVETYYSYEMSWSRFRSNVVVRKYQSKGLSFQLWPAANAVCWYLEKEFGEVGMCLPAKVGNDSPASVVYEDQLSGVPPDRKHTLPKEIEHLPGVVQESLSRPVSGNYRTPENRRMKVLELGSGTGMVGIVAACLGAHVILTDLPHVLPNAEHNMELNRGKILAAGGLVESQVLRWGVEEDVKQLGDLSSFDVILASDVVYYDTLYKPLLQTLKWLVGAAGDEAIFPDKRKNEQSHGVKHETDGSQVRVSDPPATSTPFAYSHEMKENDPAAAHKWASFSARAERRCNESVQVNKKKMQPPVIYLGHMRRWKKDSHFFKQASKVFNVDVVHRHPPQEGARVGPIIYRLQVKPNCLTDSVIPGTGQ